MEQALTQNMLEQVRTANRLVAAYYQRVLPEIEKVADNLELDFYYWGSTEFDSCPQGHRNPFQKMAWSFLPASTSHFLFHSPIKENEPKGTASKGDILLAIYLVTDSALDPDESGLSHNVEPDALDLPLSSTDATSFFKIAICVCNENNQSHWWNDIWNIIPWPEFESKPTIQIPSLDAACIATAFKYFLEDFIQNGTDELTNKIKQHSDHLLESIA